MERVVLFQNF